MVPEGFHDYFVASTQEVVLDDCTPMERLDIERERGCL